MRLSISTSKVSFTLKYSIATFLLCTSAFATGVFIGSISLVVFSATAIPIFFVAAASVSSIIALSSAIYLVKSAKSLEKVPVMPGTVTPQSLPLPPPPPPLPGQGMTVSQPPLLIQSLKDRKSSKDHDTGKSQGSFSVQSSGFPVGMLEQISAGVNLRKVKKIEPQNKENAVNSMDLAGIFARSAFLKYSSSESTDSENEFSWEDDDQDIQSSSKKEEKFTSYMQMQKPMPLQDLNVISSQAKPNSIPLLLFFNKSKNQDAELQDKLKKQREKIEKESEHSQDLSNEKIKGNRDNAKEETRQEYVEETKKQQKEKNKVEGQNDNGWIRSMILELIPPSVELTDVKKVESSGFSSGYNSDLEDQAIRQKSV